MKNKCKFTRTELLRYFNKNNVKWHEKGCN